MVIVVPAFPEGKETTDQVVSALVTGLKRMSTPDVADRVHTPGHVVFNENPNQSTPDEAGERSHPAH